MQNQKTKDQSGMAAIFVVMILISILALISVGFSHLMNKEVRQSLDRQLASQAYYAAESGINDAVDFLNSPLATSFNGCSPPAGGAQGQGFFPANGNISNNGTPARYSCISVNSNPKELTYTLKAGHSQTIVLSGVSPTSLHFTWENASYSGSPQPLGTCGGAPVTCQTPQINNSLSADATGILKTSVIPDVAVTNCAGKPHNFASGQLSLIIDPSNARLECAMRTYYLYPTGSAQLAGSYNTSDGSFIPANCNPAGQTPPTGVSDSTPRYCYQRLNNLPAASTVYIQLTAMYSDLKVGIQAGSGGGGNTALSIPNAEGVIDVTGVGNDVLRRLRAYLPKTSDTYQIQSLDTLCKLFTMPLTDPSTFGSPIDESGNDPACSKPGSGGPIP